MNWLLSEQEMPIWPNLGLRILSHPQLHGVLICLRNSLIGSHQQLRLVNSLKSNTVSLLYVGRLNGMVDFALFLACLSKEILAIKRGLFRLIRQLNDLLLTRPLHSNMLPTFITAQQINSKTFWAWWAYSNIEGHSEYRKMISHNTVNTDPPLFQLLTPW